MPAKNSELNFAAEHDVAVSYIDRSREYYLAQGYPKPYQWAHFAEVPFTPLGKPLSQASVAVITTAAPITSGRGEQGPGAPLNSAAAFEEVYSAPSDDAPQLGISHLAYDRAHTTGADTRAFFALPALSEAAAGRVGTVAPRFHGTPNRYSHRAVLEKDGPDLLDLLARLHEDKTDAVVLAAI
jgi:hypothetical protein